jgi:hypothetical protein
MEGDIAPGGKIRLTPTLAPKRIFNLEVKQFEPEKTLVWGDAMGSRTYTLDKKANGTILFCMTEKTGGPLFPLFAKMIPPFDAAFEVFAACLKKEAENIMHT